MICQDQFDYEFIFDDYPDVEPSIAVNPKNPDSVAVAWYIKGPTAQTKVVKWAALRRTGASWTVENEDTLRVPYVKAGDPVIVYLEDGTVYISTIATGGVYVSYCEDIWALDPDWSNNLIDDVGDKPWLAGYYLADSLKSYLYLSYSASGILYVADIEIDNTSTPFHFSDTITTIDSDSTGYIPFWSTIVTDSADSVYVFWTRSDQQTFMWDYHQTDIMMKKKSRGDSWPQPSYEVVSEIYNGSQNSELSSMTVITYAAVDYSVALDRIALAYSYYDTTGNDNYRIKAMYSDNHGSSWSSSIVTDSLNHQLLPWVSYASDSTLTILYNEIEEVDNIDYVNPYINFAYEGDNNFTPAPVKLNTESNYSDSCSTKYEYIGLDSRRGQVYTMWVQYGEADEKPGANVVFTNWENVAPATPSNFSVDTSGDHPVLSWSANSEVDIDHYKIKVKYWTRFDPGVGWHDRGTTTGTSYTDTNVDPPGGGIPDFIAYKIAAVDYSGKISAETDSIQVSGDVIIWPMRITDFADNLLPLYNKLDEAYPNPFNPMTTIKYELPDNGRVSIVVYDMMGREVTQLVNSVEQAGYHYVIWDASTLASGIYFVNMRSGTFNKTQKLMLAK